MTPRACLRLLLPLALLAASSLACAQDGVTWRKVDRANLVFIGMREGEIVRHGRVAAPVRRVGGEK